jgi:hypothetical protein
MFIRSSDQLPSVTVLRRFPVPRNFNVSSESRIERGKTWHTPSGTNWLACTRFISDTAEPATIYPLNHLRVIKDLVPDLTQLFAQYSLIEPWLETTTPEPEKERLQSPEDRGKLDGFYECILCFCCTSGCPSHWWNGDRSGSSRAPAVLSLADRQPGRSDRRSARRPRRPVPALSLPHHPQLHPNVPEGAKPR